MLGAQLVAKPAAYIEEKGDQRTNANSGVWSKPLTGLGRGRLARAHACGRASTSGSGGDHSMVAKLRRSRRPRCCQGKVESSASQQSRNFRFWSREMGARGKGDGV